MVKQKILIVLSISFIVLIFGVNLTTATTTTSTCEFTCTSTTGTICIQNPLKSCSFEDLVNSIINFIFYVAVALAPLMIIIGAFYLLTSGGSEQKIKTGKDIMMYTVIGLTIVLLAKGLISVIKQLLGG